MSCIPSFDEIYSLRQSSHPLSRSVAPAITCKMFKSPHCLEKPISKDFTYFLSIESKNRLPATLKACGEFLRSDTISLGTGRPSPQYFPFVGMSLELPQGPDFSKCPADGLVQTSTGKYDILERDASCDLAVALNYGYSAGSEQLVRFLTEHVDVVHNPPYSNWQVSLTVGNTSALDGALRMFCTRGDYVITEEYTYSGAIEAMRPLGLRAAAIEMDEQGLLPDRLDDILNNWNEVDRGAKKPFLLYMIPTGQNPSGASQGVERRRQIYKIAERHDLYIIEDDPYYYLQLEKYKITPSMSKTGFDDHTLFRQDLVPSYLSIDRSGRVLRLDSTSKILAPGLRCGWMTASSYLIERFLYHHDVSTVSPSGLSQLAVYNLLDKTWGHNGFMAWLQYLRTEYSYRRDVMIKSCNTYLPTSICSWKIPTAGMFHWIRIDWMVHPLVVDRQNSLSFSDFLEIEDRIFEAALENGVMCCKGSTFRSDQYYGKDMFFRTTYASATPLQLEEAIKRFGRAIIVEFIRQPQIG